MRDFSRDSPAASGRGSERPTLVAGNDWFHGIGRLVADMIGGFQAALRRRWATTARGVDWSQLIGMNLGRNGALDTIRTCDFYLRREIIDVGPEQT